MRRHGLAERKWPAVTSGPPLTTRDLRLEGVATLRFLVKDMCCADEVRLVEAALTGVPGVTRLDFDLVRRRLVVVGTVTAATVQRSIKRVGLLARLEGEEVAAPTFWERRGRLSVTVLSGVALIAGLLAEWTGLGNRISIPLLALSTVAGGWFIVPRGIRAARGHALDMNFLMTAAAIGAAAIGEWAEAASAMFLFAVAQLVESYSMDRARNAIRALMSLSPPEALVRRGGAEQVVPVAEVEIGETIVTKPGQRIALDGVVVSGRSAVDQSPITGESMPVDKEAGADVFAGSINQHGALDVCVTKLAEDTTLARIIHAVEEAQASRAPSQSFVDRFARIYTPVVVGLAILVAILPPLVGLGDFTSWLYRALTMLVIACPCALVISTPVTIVSGLAGAARGGVLIKGGAYLEAAGAVATIAFDKTGTLTRGRPVVTDVVPLGSKWREVDVLARAAAVERHSEHPLAKSIHAEALARGLDIPPSADFTAFPGRGAVATIEGMPLSVGNQRFLEERGLGAHDLATPARQFEQDGRSVTFVLEGTRVMGLIALADTLRDDARQAIAALRRDGIRRIIMLTGDNEGAARSAARQLGVDEVFALLLPKDKVRIVRELQANGTRVVFVGDGINDAPALAAADVGIAMGVAGTDVALETADVALMGDDLTRLEFVIRLSRKTLGIIKQNIVFSIAIKAVFLVLALAGWATLWMAVAADMGASLLVVANGLRALSRSAVPKERGSL
jgi:Zn2+/Cd2+-exporting ATPase